ncbi:MAG: hypothetical protein QOI52_2168 [Chloroflexota bacterium]|nr:hypothetical protein [Chloroflexota bacterium]
MPRPLTFLIALGGCAALTAGTAQATPVDGTYRGKTSQRYKVVVKVKGGRVKSVDLPWVDKCRDKRYRWGPIKQFRWTDDPDEPIEQKGDSFSDGGKSTHDVKGEHSVTEAHLKGHFSGKRVSGTQVTKVHVRTGGERDYCHARIRWSAKLVG